MRRASHITPTTSCGSRSRAWSISSGSQAGYQRLRDLGVEALVLESHVRYIQPAAFDDRLLVHARCVDVKGARFRYEYAIGRDGSVDRRRWTAHATVDATTLRPTRIPAWLAEDDRSASETAQSGDQCGGLGSVVVVVVVVPASSSSAPSARRG